GVPFVVTGAGTTWQDASVTATLSAGANTVRATATTANGGPNVDRLTVTDGGCNPMWDGSRPLTGGDDQAKINAIRGAGGDVIVSFGGWSGNKLGEKCTSASALAGAYQKVINAYKLKAIDIDIEDTEFSNATVRQRVIS